MLMILNFLKTNFFALNVSFKIVASPIGTGPYRFPLCKNTHFKLRLELSTKYAILWFISLNVTFIKEPTATNQIIACVEEKKKLFMPIPMKVYPDIIL